MAITSPRMGSGNTKYPYKRKLKPGNPPAKAKYGIEVPEYQDGGSTEGRRRRRNTSNVAAPVESSSNAPVNTTLPAFSPYNTGLRPSYTPAKSDVQTQTPTMAIDPVDEDVLAFTQAYVESPKYQQRLGNFYKYPDYIQRQRIQKLSNVGFTKSSGTSSTAYSDTSAYPNQLNVDTNQLNRIRADRAEAVAHELGHATNASDENAALRLNPLEENFIYNRNKTLTPEQRERYRQSAKIPSRDNPNATLSGYLGQEELHDLAPSETISDVQALRYQMNKAGIYDARTQDLTPEVLQKALSNPQIKSQFSTKRLLENFKQNDLLDILNKVALNQQSGEASNVAKWGGKIRKMQDGGKTDKKNTSKKGTSETVTNLGRNMASYFLGVKNTGTIPSQYRPSKSSDPNAKYQTWPYLKNDVKADLTSPTYINNINTQQKNFSEQNPNYLPSYVNEANFDQLYNYYQNSPKSNRVSGSSINLGQYSVTPGQDDKGRYIGIYDKYDWNLLEGLGIKGNSWETYDRIYEDEWDNLKNTKEMKNGGLSREEDYGSKKKPYPSVSKGDFAGGGRSYPIPTKADAIDALRLAGLHGRSDVKAKVYKKYPELRKEFGGEIFEQDANKVQNIWYPKLKAELGAEVPDGYHLMPDGTVMANSEMNGDGYAYAKKGIYIKPENRGKFTATKKRTGKTTEELTHSKNPVTRKRAIFAQNARKWHKGEYGLKVMQGGGDLDPNDPMFAQKLQELLRTNPELAQDIFSPATPSTPPGTSDLTRIDLPDGQYADPNGDLFRALNSDVIGGESVDDNTNAQQNKPKNSKPKVSFPSINVGDAVSLGVQGLDLLATEYIDKPRKRANEMRLLRQQLAPVISKPSTGGYDMPVLAKSGIQITSAYTDPVGLPSPTRKRNPFGNVANNFKVDDPNFANVLAEGGEFLELPDGQTSTITGDLHSDYSGGEFMNLPEGSKIYSDSIKVDKSFASDLTGNKSNKKKTVAQLAKKFNTEHEEGILKDPTSDNISKRSANIMKTFKQSQLQQLFDYQESVKDPMYMINKEQSAADYMGSEDQVVAKRGVKVLQDGGKPPKKRKPPIGVLAPTDTGLTTYKIVNGQPVATTGQVPEDNVLPNGQPWWMNIQGVQGVPPPVNLRGQMAMLQQPTSTPKLTTPNSTPSIPESTPETPWTPLQLEPVQGVRAPDLQVAVPPVTIPIGEPIDPNKSRKPMPDNNKVNPPKPNPKVPWSNTLNSLGEIVPEIAAYIQNETDFPVFTGRYQPRYLNPVELNIQASLNRNYAQTAPLLEGSSGNPSIDNARAAQALSNLYDANNEAFQQKFNFDTQNRYQTDATNLQIENQANLLNLQRADQYWDKITQRQAVKEATRNNIINSAYSKFKRKQLEDRSLQLTNQMFDNFKYDPARGVYFTPSGDEYIFHEPSGNFINIASTPGDGVETTRTVRNTPKGTTTTLRQKEKKGS